MSVGKAAISAAPWRGAMVALAILSMPVGPAFAQPVSYPDLAEPLPESPNRTYADLVRLVVPGIGGDGASGSGVIDLRHIDGTDMAGLEPMSVGSPRIAVVPARSRGLDRVQA